MTSRKRVSLQERQLRMYLRNRPRRKRTVDREKLRRRIAATVLLRKGWPVDRIAAQVGITVEAFTRWQQAGCPLL